MKNVRQQKLIQSVVEIFPLKRFGNLQTHELPQRCKVAVRFGIEKIQH